MKHTQIKNVSSNILSNLNKNKFLLLSGMAFFCLEPHETLAYVLSIIIAVVMLMVIASKKYDIEGWVKSSNRKDKFFCIITAVGICWSGQCNGSEFYSKMNNFKINSELAFGISVLFAVLSFWFVYIVVSVVWKKIVGSFIETNLFSGIDKREKLIYAFMIIAMMSFMAFVFFKTEAFYGTNIKCDIIYTSDSPLLVTNNSWLSLTHRENDLRQPLFGVFAAPLTGFAYFLGRIIPVSKSIQVILLNCSQILVLFFANFMLAKMLKLEGIRRVMFLFLLHSTYTQVLTILMLEQYIVAYFWLIFSFYLLHEKGYLDRFAFCGAAGTLLTSGVLILFTSEKSAIKKLYSRMIDVFKSGITFLLLILVCGRFDIIYNLKEKVLLLSTFTGKTVTWKSKILQYFSFLQYNLIAPDAGVNTTAYEHISWQMYLPKNLEIGGVIVFLFVIISVFMNRKKKSSFYAAFWCAFSVIILLILGWGTKENGLILYTLYFGWAFFLLLFQFLESIFNKNRTLFCVISVISILLLWAKNLPSIIEMVTFAIRNYPI